MGDEPHAGRDVTALTPRADTLHASHPVSGTAETEAFLILRDAGLTQVVISDVRTRVRVEALTEESVVEITATVTANAAAPTGVELVAPDVRL
jgi:aspartyl/asparaginyl-tRNA synthetase